MNGLRLLAISDFLTFKQVKPVHQFKLEIRVLMNTKLL